MPTDPIVIQYIAPTEPSKVEWVNADCGHRVPAHFANRYTDVDNGGEPKYVVHCLNCAGATSSFGDTEDAAEA
jgi:hypothetical protein